MATRIYFKYLARLKVERAMQKIRRCEAYTDGSCKPNPGVGGWGWVMYESTELSQNYDENTSDERYCIANYEAKTSSTLVWQDWGGLKHTTNQQMELTSMAEFLEFCPTGNNVYVDIFSDSEYTLGGIVQNTRELRKFTEVDGWMRGWLSKKFGGCTTYNANYWKKDVKNGEEWYRIHRALLKHLSHGTNLRFCWVKGHSGIKGNEKADKLAGMFSP